MELTGRIIDIMEAKSGKSVKTGNPWMMQEYVIEVPIALDYADNSTLNEFSNPHSYNHFDVEALFIYAMGESNDYQKIRETYKEVQNIVDEDPNRLLGETKKILEQRVKQDKKNKMQYAVLFAAAVIEWYLKHH